MRLLFVLLLALSAAPAWAARSLDRLALPTGFHIAVYSGQVPQARELALGAKGTVVVGSMDAGKVHALTDADHDGRAETVRVVASGLQLPVGVAFHKGDLYVSAVSRILVLRDIQPLPDGSLLVSDDLAGSVYRVTYGR